jgi:dephospho-CoA kinase
MSKRIILTGGISSGKSTVAKLLEENGITVIDSDIIAKNIFSRNITTIQKMFDTTLKGNKLRAFVGNIIFSQPLMKMKFEALMHPKIRNIIKTRERKLKGKNHIIDIPLYFETKFFLEEDFVILISIPYETQVKRLMKRNNFTKEEADKRIISQLPTAIKEKKSNYVITNDGSFEDLEKKVNILISEIFTV